MISSEDLAKALMSTEGLALVSIRAPSHDPSGKWVINKRYGEAAWQYGKPHTTLDEALTAAFPKLTKTPSSILDDLF